MRSNLIKGRSRRWKHNWANFTSCCILLWNIAGQRSLIKYCSFSKVCTFRLSIFGWRPKNSDSLNLSHSDNLLLLRTMHQISRLSLLKPPTRFTLEKDIDWKSMLQQTYLSSIFSNWCFTSSLSASLPEALCFNWTELMLLLLMCSYAVNFTFSQFVNSILLILKLRSVTGVWLTSNAFHLPKTSSDWLSPGFQSTLMICGSMP